MGTDYFVRSRGKISGPFDLVYLQKLAHRGALSRAHEVSLDRAAWTLAGEYEELFPARMVQPGQAPPPQTAQVTPTSAGSSMYYYIQNGITVGPVPLSVLVSLSQNGTLHADDRCWPEGAQVATFAAQLPSLAQFFAVRGNAGSAGAPLHLVSDADRLRARLISSRTNFLCQVAGIVVGALMLLLLSLPIWSDSKVTYWWWDILQFPNSGSASVPIFFTFFASLIAGIVGAAVHGLARAWIFIGISAMSLILFLATGSTVPGLNGAVLLFTMIIPYLAAALIGVSLLRSDARGLRIGALSQAIFGGSLLFCVLIALLLAELLKVPQDYADGIRLKVGSNQLPEWAVLSTTIASIGFVSAIAAGVVGLIASRPTPSSALNWTTIGSALGYLALMCAAFTLFGYGFAKLYEYDKVGLLTFNFFRASAIFCAFPALLSFGLLELYTILRIRKFLAGA